MKWKPCFNGLWDCGHKVMLLFSSVAAAAPLLARKHSPTSRWFENWSFQIYCKFHSTYCNAVSLLFAPKSEKLRTPNFSRLTRLFFRKPCALFWWIRARMQCLHSAVITTSRRVISLSGTHSNIATVRCYVKGKRIRVAAAASTLWN